MNAKSVFIFTISFPIYPRVLPASLPANRDWARPTLLLFICISPQTRFMLEKGPSSYGPNCCKCGWRFSWTTGTSYPKLCEFAERW